MSLGRRWRGRLEGGGVCVCAGASPRVSTTTRGTTSFRTSQLVCRAGLEFISSSHTWAQLQSAPLPANPVGQREAEALASRVTLGRSL